VKRRAVGIFLIAFAVWPLIQFSLTQHYDASPWKLFGWGMYSVPGAMKTVRILALTQGQKVRLPFQAYSPEEQKLVDRFRGHRQALGLLASPVPLAEGMLALRPDYDGVVIAVLTLSLNRETARLDAGYEYSTHWRDERDQPVELSDDALKRVFRP
jgi:hypothetical protein